MQLHFIRFYASLLHFYPSAFQHQFSDELQTVFCDLMDEAAAQNSWQVWLCFIRECYALPGNIIQAYRGEKFPMLPQRQIVKINVIGFGIAFILLALLNSITTYLLSPINPGEGFIFFYIVYLLLASITVGVFGGGAIATSLSAQRKTPFILACGLGYMLSELLTSYSFWAALGLPIEWINRSWATFFTLGAPLINGLLIGLLVGKVWKDWKTGFLFALISGIIFELGFWVNWTILFLLYTQGQHSLSGSTPAGLFWITWTGVVSYLAFGALVGLLWGVLVGKVSRQTQAIA